MFFGFMMKISKCACVKVYVREKTGSVFGGFPHQFCMEKVSLVKSANIIPYEEKKKTKLGNLKLKLTFYKVTFC